MRNFVVTVLGLIVGIQCLSASGLQVGTVCDRRYQVARDMNTLFDVTYLSAKYNRLKDWKSRATEVRQEVLCAAGLVPMPEKTPLEAKVFGKIDRDDYTIEKVYFQSYPGLFVTGNLYRPRQTQDSAYGPFPGVLCPHGHGGRFANDDLVSTPGLCINLAKQGYVAFSYDMIGFGDGWQIIHSTYPNWFYGNAEEMTHGGTVDLSNDVIGFRRDQLLWGVSVGGLQLWDSIRSLDFLQSLPYVDKDRIACTGHSGGGTQTYLLTAVDDRILVSAPVSMLSARMQGGCLCENLPNLRIDTNNVEIGALMAPRPTLLVSATGDWTKEVPKIEYPAIRHIYKLFDAEDKVSCHLVDAEHNYNKESREVVYSWLGRWLPKKPLSQPVREQKFLVEKIDDLRVFPNKQAPKGALDKDALARQLVAAAKSQLEANRPRDGQTLDRFRQIYSPVLRNALSITVSPDTEAEARGQEVRNGYIISKLVLRDRARGAEIPALLVSPADNGQEEAVLMVNEKGKQGCLDSVEDFPSPIVDALVKSGRRVLLIDCFGTGEHIAPQGLARTNLQTSKEEMAPYSWFDTYNRSDTAERVYDILAALNYLEHIDGARSVSLVGSGKAGLWCLLTRPFDPHISRTVSDVAGFDTSSDEAFIKDLYVPCLRRAGDLRTAIAVSAPTKLFIHNTQAKFDTSWAKDVYTAIDQAGLLRIERNMAPDSEIVGWLTTPE
ncbi:MAG: acetylxylan esterase [Armatimonadetes bacterium]|nr:acetylxylan esterase [Armatimonadota bacterium]